MDLLLGENSPTFSKTENITDNDFYLGDTSQSLYLFCELTRDINEEINYSQIYNCYGYYYHSKITDWIKKDNGKYIPIKSPVLHTIREDSEYFWSDLDGIINIDENDESLDDRGYKIIDKDYVNPKLRNQGTFEAQFNNKYKFALAFRASKAANGKINKEIRFLYREKSESKWILGFSAPIRNEFIQSVIIPSFRDPTLELRINQWSSFGKLLKNYIKSDDQNLTGFLEI